MTWPKLSDGAGIWSSDNLSPGKWLSNHMAFVRPLYSLFFSSLKRCIESGGLYALKSLTTCPERALATQEYRQ